MNPLNSTACAFIRGSLVSLSNAILAWFVLCFSFVTFAEPIRPITSSLRFEHFDIDDGLSQNSISDIVQDKYGFIWFSTQGGINRYDGHQFTVFKHQPENADSLSDSYVLTMFVDEQGELWIGTHSGGLNRFDYLSETFSHFISNPSDGHGISGNRITAIAQVFSDELLIGTFGGGISRFDITEQRFIEQPLAWEADKYSQINAIAGDGGDIWLGTNQHGLLRLSNDYEVLNAFEYDSIDDKSLSSNSVTSLFIDSKNDLWVGTDKGLNRFDNRCNCFERFFYQQETSADASAGVINTIIEDKKGRLWIGTNDGLKVLAANRSGSVRFENVMDDKYSLRSNLIKALYLGDDNVMWIGYFITGGGKLDLTTEQFHHHKKQGQGSHSLANNSIWQFIEAEDGAVWISTDGGGISRFDRTTEQFEHYWADRQTANSLSSNYVWSLAEGPPGIIWAGTFDAGLNRFDTRTGEFRHYKHGKNPGSISSNHVISLFIDSRYQFWVGTADGLNRMNRQTGRFEHFKSSPSDPNSLCGNWVASINEDKQGRIWVSTAGGGTCYYDYSKQTFTRVKFDTNQPFSPATDITPMSMQDHQGDIWTTTYGAGIAKLDSVTGLFKRLTEADGLAHNSALGIVEGSPGSLWITTNNGLSRFDSDSGRFVNFSTPDGLQSNEFNSGAYLKTQDGELFLGGINGFNHFYPDSVKKIDPALQVRLTGMRLFNKAVEIGQSQAGEPFKLAKPLYLLDGLRLTHDLTLFAFEFSALAFSHVDEVVFEYQLEGFDRQWISTGHKLPMATYTNIPAGDYLFRVRARLSHQAWSDRETVLPVTILPPPWLSWWAYTLYVLVVLSVVGYLLVQRYRRFVAVKLGKERLTLALWGSHSEFWDWDLAKNRIYRSNHFKQNDDLAGSNQFEYEQLRRLIHKDDVEQVIDDLQRHIKNESEYFDSTYRRLNQQGQWIWYRSRAQAVNRDSDGKALRIVGTVSDVNELKQAQLQLHQSNEQLESRVLVRTKELTEALEQLKSTQLQLVESEKMASLGDLVIGISHELNTPLGVALTSITMISDRLLELSAKKAAKQMRASDFDEFERSAHASLTLLTNNLVKAIELVHSFKALSPKSEGGEKTTFSLAKLFEDLKLINAGMNVHHPAQLNIECIDTLMVTTYCSELLEVFKELLENSYIHGFKHTDAPVINIEAEITPEHLLLTYWDNGCGVKEHSKLFEPFYTSERGSNCTGLGMTIIYNKVHYRFAGRVMIDSEKQDGFCLKLYLPTDIIEG